MRFVMLLLVMGCGNKAQEATDDTGTPVSTDGAEVEGTLVHPDGTEEALISGISYTTAFGDRVVALLPWQASCQGTDELDWIGQNAPDLGYLVVLRLEGDSIAGDSAVEVFFDDASGRGMGTEDYLVDPTFDITRDDAEGVEGVLEPFETELAPPFTGQATFSVPVCG